MKFFPRKLSRRQIDKLSDISSDIALVSLASVVLPAVFDRYDPYRVGLGLGVSLFLWLLSIWIRR